MRRWRRGLFRIAVFLLVGLLLAAPAAAIQPMTGNQDSKGNLVLEKGKTIEDDVFAAGNEIVIDGDINGDLMVFGQKITVNGVINGDVFGAAQTITINGQIRDDARLAAEEIQINGKVERNLTTASRQLVIVKGGLVGRNALVAAETTNIEGTLKGNLQGAMATLNVQGTLGGSGVIEADRVIVGPAGIIQGGLQYTSSREAEVNPGGRIAGPVERKEPVVNVSKDQKQQPSFWFALLTTLKVYLSGLLLWFLWRTFFPASFKAWTDSMTGSLGKSFLLGFALLFAVVVGAILVFFTIVGIPLSVLTLIAYGVTLYLSKLAVAQALGDEVFRRMGWPQKKWAFPLGLLAIVLLGLIPYVGFLLKAAICMVGLGSASIALYRASKRANPLA